MKKLVSLLVMFIAINASAQSFHFSPKVGLNLSDMTNSEADMRVGLNVGLTGEYMVTPQFSIEPGVFYSMQGIKGSEEGVSTTLKNDYINIPVLAKYYIGEGSGLNFFAGPQASILTSSKVKASIPGLSLDNIDFKNFMNSFDFGLVAGLGYQLDMGLSISANYNFGFLNALKTNELWGDNKSYNRVIQINAGWRF